MAKKKSGPPQDKPYSRQAERKREWRAKQPPEEKARDLAVQAIHNFIDRFCTADGLTSDQRRRADKFLSRFAPVTDVEGLIRGGLNRMTSKRAVVLKASPAQLKSFQAFLSRAKAAVCNSARARKRAPAFTQLNVDSPLGVIDSFVAEGKFIATVHDGDKSERVTLGVPELLARLSAATNQPSYARVRPSQQAWAALFPALPESLLDLGVDEDHQQHEFIFTMSGVCDVGRIIETAPSYTYDRVLISEHGHACVTLPARQIRDARLMQVDAMQHTGQLFCSQESGSAWRANNFHFDFGADCVMFRSHGQLDPAVLSLLRLTH